MSGKINSVDSPNQTVVSDVPEISVIIPVYNSEKYLAAALDSVLAQSFQNFEIVCVNDGSTDSSPAVLDAYAASDARIRVIHQENAGGAASRNTGLAAAKGRYIAFMDNDDLYHPDCLKTLADGFRKYPQAWVSVGGYVGFSDGEKPNFSLSKFRFWHCFSKPFWAKYIFKAHIPMFMWLKLYRRECFKNIRFNEKLPSSNDVPLFLEILLLNKPFAWTRFPVYAYRAHPAQQCRKQFEEKTEIPDLVRSIALLARKNKGINRFILERIAAKVAYEGMVWRKNPTEAQKSFRKREFENLIAEKALNLSRLSHRRRKEILKIIGE